MLLLAITPERPVDREGHKIAALLQAGWFRVHLRHPGASRSEIRDIIESIPQRLHSRLVLHGHFDLINEFNIGGLHLNRRCPVPPPLYKGAVSRSCHSVDEIAASGHVEYVTLSPVFNSISKPGYESIFTSDELRGLDAITSPPIIALGGITPERIGSLKRYNIRGCAMLGAIPWQESPENIYRFAINTLSLC